MKGTERDSEKKKTSFSFQTLCCLDTTFPSPLHSQPPFFIQSLMSIIRSRHKQDNCLYFSIRIHNDIIRPSARYHV